MSDISTSIEAMVDFHRDTIVRCIREPTIVSHLVPSVISGDDGIKLKDEYEKDTFKATEQLLDLVCKSTDLGKWKSFVDALERAEYDHLANILQTNTRQVDNHKHERQMLQIFCPVLEKRIDVIEIIDSLFSNQVINDIDRQQVFAKRESKGNMYATIVLLDRMQIRQSPQTWYNAFLCALKEAGYDDIVEDMEPGFDDADASTMSKRKHDDMDIVENTTPKRPRGPLGDECCASSSGYRPNQSTVEHIMTDYQDADMSDDMASPPQQVDSRGSELKEEAITLKIKQELIDDADEKGSDHESEDACKEEESVLAEEDYAIDSNLTLRDYQCELAEKAQNENVIICEGTGIGKTIVALEVIKKHLEASDGTRKVAFMAPNNILVNQQAKTCKTVLPQFSTMVVSSEDDPSMMLGAVIPEFDILFFTPQILVNNLDNESVASVGTFSLLVFDECHHTKGNNPYNNIMRKYLLEKFSGTCNRLPQILGLTASLGIGNSQTPAEACEYMLGICARMDVRKLPTVETYKEQLLEFTAIPTEESRPLQKRDHDPCRKILISAIQYSEDKLADKMLDQPSLIALFTDKCPTDKECMAYNQWTSEVIQEARKITDDTATAQDIILCAEYLNTFIAALEVNRLMETNNVLEVIAQRHRLENQQTDKISATEKALQDKLQGWRKDIAKKGRGVKNPNISIISNMLREMILQTEQKNEESRAMVFVKTRATCKALAKLLGKDLQDIRVKVEALYGKGKRGEEEGLEEKRQNEIMEKFRDGYYKVIVATSIGSEGIDIPNCNIALCYDYTETEVKKIQMKGRTRKKDGSMITFGSEKTLLKDKVNVYKLAIMQKGLERARSLDPQTFARNVKSIQEEEVKHVEIQLIQLKADRERQKENVDFVMKCINCSAFACNVSDIRKIGSHHICTDRTFVDKIFRKPLTSKWDEYDGFTKRFKLGCKNCNRAIATDWGVAAEKNGVLCYQLKLKMFKLYRSTHTSPVYFKKWIKVPYKIPEIEVEEMRALLSS